MDKPILNLCSDKLLTHPTSRIVWNGEQCGYKLPLGFEYTYNPESVLSIYIIPSGTSILLLRKGERWILENAFSYDGVGIPEPHNAFYPIWYIDKESITNYPKIFQFTKDELKKSIQHQINAETAYLKKKEGDLKYLPKSIKESERIIKKLTDELNLIE